MKGLIIKEQWLNKILHENKTLEIRNNNTKNTNEEIYLLESNTHKIKAIAIIKNTIKLNKNNWEVLKSKHQVNISFEALLNIYNNPYAWNIEVIKELKENITYEHLKGCVIWVDNLQNYNNILNNYLPDYNF